MNSIRAIWKTLLQKFPCVIGLRNDYTRCIDKFIQTGLEISRRENIIGVGGKAESDWEKFVDPESSARGHSGEVCVNVMNPHFLQAQSDISCLIKAEKIGTPAPLIESSNNFSR